jgi:glucosyl-dolichyl phosphate glucuronosyltransferase
MKISVLLCTYNRAESLARALASVAKSQMPDDAVWEVLVVDNNSSDNTRAVVAEFAEHHPQVFRYVFEPKPGKSNALNRGIRETNADVLAFMDDDVQVEPDWLNKLTLAFSDAAYSGSGGRIIPEADFSVPLWLETSEHYALAPLAMFDLGPVPGELKEPPFGTNMAFRREVFSHYGDFRCDLGPQPGSEIRSEDTEFGMRLLRGGERLWYEPAAVVHHDISAKRLTQRYFLKWWFDKARADVREHGLPAGTRLIVAGIPLYLIRRLIIWTLRWMLTFRVGPRFSAKLKLWTVLGAIKECRDRSKCEGLTESTIAASTSSSQ